MEPNLGFLFAAFFVSWLVLLLYIWALASRLAGVQRQLEELLQEQRRREEEEGCETRRG